MSGKAPTKKNKQRTTALDLITEQILARIRKQGPVQRVVLFGSRARGEARPGSDFDILVIKESDEPRHRRSIPYYEAVADLPVEVEIVIYTPEEVMDWSQVPEAFVTTALREGKVLYERKV
ncbi:MAG TPA: nucleotidyltransferase domain-containing protein [bacterium]|nr:nucleotidyltransferase domain-containing protein [bacterium]